MKKPKKLTNAQIYAKAVVRYEKGGASAVYDLANSLNWKKWHYCEGCEAETPAIKVDNDDEFSCMVCGQTMDVSQRIFYVPTVISFTATVAVKGKTLAEARKTIEKNLWGKLETLGDNSNDDIVDWDADLHHDSVTTKRPKYVK
jgi:hypothetical protein